ncbi:hypothetical protein AB204_04730 [Xenorhabdus khoisanae]|uniref:Uncharacterized protein n=1 Tax=Xenorhabdus khoisanae TaxID=880157 RepID=A0A0J5FVB8_9GAMM|nr:hypothetical protein AB204_04730 [Xenorhabdus khoisanae]
MFHGKPLFRPCRYPALLPPDTTRHVDKNVVLIKISIGNFYTKGGGSYRKSVHHAMKSADLL